MEAASVTWRPLGELFVGRGLITEAELETALAEQAATGKRLGEILVERGLVSGPDLTSALMDQLGVEISKEEGYGSGLWAEIKRRHKRVPRDEDAEAKGEDDVEAEAQAPEIALVPPIEELTPEPEAFEAQSFEPEASFEPEVFAPEFVAGAEPVVEATAVDPGLEQELAEIAADYQPPAEREPEPEPEFAAGAVRRRERRRGHPQGRACGRARRCRAPAGHARGRDDRTCRAQRRSRGRALRRDRVAFSAGSAGGR